MPDITPDEVAPEPDGMDLAREFALEQRAREHAEKTGPTIGGEPALDVIRATMRERCPRCMSPDPRRHPAMQSEGEVQLCRDPWHAPTAEQIEAAERGHEVHAAINRCAASRAMALALNSLPYVRWDRCIRHDDGTVAYGWISRDDGRDDFVVLKFDASGELEEFTSSSARYSRQLYATLIGDDEGHTECERITEVFGDAIANTVSRPSG